MPGRQWDHTSSAILLHRRRFGEVYSLLAKETRDQEEAEALLEIIRKGREVRK
jgi:hypothetical protein